MVATYLDNLLGDWGPDVINVLYGTDDYVAGAALMGLSACHLRRERRALHRAMWWLRSHLSCPRGGPVLVLTP